MTKIHLRGFHSEHQRPQRDAHPWLDGQLKLPISLPIGCSRFDWFVINSSYWPVEQDGWRHGFVLLTHYPTESGPGGGSGHQYKALQLLSSSPSPQHTHTHPPTQYLTHTVPHKHTQTDPLAALGWFQRRRNLNHLRRCWRQTKTTEILCVRGGVCVCVDGWERRTKQTLLHEQQKQSWKWNFTLSFLWFSLVPFHTCEQACLALCALASCAEAEVTRLTDTSHSEGQIFSPRSRGGEAATDRWSR